MLTAAGTVRDRVEGLSLGADDYLPKPFDFAELVARVRALGRRPANALPPVLEFDDLTVDPTLDRDHVRRRYRADRLEHDRDVLLDDDAGGDRHGLRSAAAFLGLRRGRRRRLEGARQHCACRHRENRERGDRRLSRHEASRTGDCVMRNIIEDGPMYHPSRLGTDRFFSES